MAEGKWIQNLKANTPLADAARHVLTVRLEVVRDALPLALHQADQDAEHVHQLRVSTRRARRRRTSFPAASPRRSTRPRGAICETCAASPGKRGTGTFSSPA